MGTVRVKSKKGAKSKKPAKKANGRVAADPAPQILTEVSTIREQTANVLASFSLLAEQLTGGTDAVPQTLLEAAVEVDKLKKQVTDAAKIFDDAVKYHYNNGGTFEHGRIGISFPETVRRTPQWKAEAIRLAIELGNTEKAYVASVMNTCKVSTSMSVKLTESV